MQATIFIPYANGDCIRGFVYKGKTLTRQEYDKLIREEYLQHKDGIDEMMTNQLGYNISFNNFKKRKIKYTQMTYFFHECPCEIYDIDGNNFTLSDLDALHRTGENFLIKLYLEPRAVLSNPDMQTDINLYVTESVKVHKCHRLGVISDEEMLLHLPKKDFKVCFKEDGSTAVLQKCQLLERIEGSNVRFVLMVDKLLFVNENKC